MCRFNQYLENPFRANKTEFDECNAIWLAELSGLAYEDRVTIEREINGISGTPFQFEGHIDGPETSTQGFIVASAEAVIVSFRGTQTLGSFKHGVDESRREEFRALFHDVIRDVRSDARFALSDWPDGGQVHRGFRAALDEVWDKPAPDIPVRQKIEELVGENPSRRVWFTGHSLGAALATLAADRYPRTFGVYTFGSPCVGDESFRNGFTVPSALRIQNDQDIVTKLPPNRDELPGLGTLYNLVSSVPEYRHVGTLRHFDENGQLLSSVGYWKQAEIAGKLLFLLKDGRGTIRDGFQLMVPFDMLRDHAIAEYIRKIKNLL